MKKTAKPQVLGPDELSVFCYELSLMVQAGIGSEESVGILAQDALSLIHIFKGIPAAGAVDPVVPEQITALPRKGGKGGGK